MGVAALAACAMVLAVCGGCRLYGWNTLRAGHVSVDGGHAVGARLDGATALELSWDMGSAVSVGTFIPRDGEACNYFAWGVDWGMLSSMGPHYERQWLIAYTYIGHWRWPDAPERDGLMTGIRLGVRVPDQGTKHRPLSVEASMDWRWLNDAAGEADAELETVAFGVALVGRW
jgi:hypothetical protein